VSDRSIDALVADVRARISGGPWPNLNAHEALGELARRAEKADARERAAVLEGERRIDALDRQAAVLREALRNITHTDDPGHARDLARLALASEPAVAQEAM
jgi:hypothetical protein